MTPERRAEIEAMVGDLKWTLGTGDLYNAIEDLLDEIDRLADERDEYRATASQLLLPPM